MPNQHVLQRLEGLQSILKGVHQSSIGLSSATTGQERAAFIDQFLSQVLPPIYRFGTGDVTDTYGARSGQLDVVVEYPIAPSLPIVGAGQTRLYLAESVAAVIEVKSNLSGQWNEAIHTSDLLAPLRKRFDIQVSFLDLPGIPLFAVGYTGWMTMSTLQDHLARAPHIHGALLINPGLYVSNFGTRAHGPLALWGLIIDLHRITTALQTVSMRPSIYGI